MANFYLNIFLKSLLVFLLVGYIHSTFVIDIYRDNILEHKLPADFEKKNNRTNETITLYKFMNAEYYGIIGVGKPAQEFKVIFDTSWSDSWIPSQHCGFFNLACMIHNRYDGSKSSTYQRNGTACEIESSDMAIKGIVSVDNFHLPHLTLYNQSFIEVTYMSEKPFMTVKADGMIGLGWQSLRRCIGTPFFQNLFKQKIIKKNVFTFYMNRDETTNKAGNLLLGEVERKHVNGSLTVLPVISKKYWTIHMDKILVAVGNKSYELCAKGCDAVMDTSVNTITGPPAEINQINNFLGANQIMKFWPYRSMVNCRTFAKLPRITFVLGSEKFTIDSKYYIQHLVFLGSQLCLSPFVPSTDNSEIWELGGAFMMQFYTEFDFGNGTISIGKTIF